MLLLRISFVKASESQNDRPIRTSLVNLTQSGQNKFLSMIQGPDSDHNGMRPILKLLEVFARIIAGFVEAARIKKCQQRRFGIGKMIFTGKAGTRFEAMTDFCLIGAG